MRIAYFSPLSPQRTGIAEYSEDVLPVLSQEVDVDVLVDGPAIGREIGCSVFQLADYPTRQLSRGYAVNIYQMGNSRYHEGIYRTLSQRPGITVLHELVLHHFVSEITMHRGNEAGFVREMTYAHGPAGASAARGLLRRSVSCSPIEYPLTRRVVDTSLLVLVHSRYVAEQVRQISPAVPVRVIPAPAPSTTVIDAAPARAWLGLPEDAFLVGSFGLATPEKRYDVALAAFRRFLDKHPNALYLIVGEVPTWYPLQETVEQLDLRDRVRLVEWVDCETLDGYLSAIDVCLNLRYPTMGETSASLLRSLHAGKATVISQVGAFDELPDSCCRKVAIDEHEEDAIVKILTEFAESPEERRRVGAAGLAHVRQWHQVRQTVRGYCRAIAEVVGCL